MENTQNKRTFSISSSTDSPDFEVQRELLKRALVNPNISYQKLDDIANQIVSNTINKENIFRNLQVLEFPFSVSKQDFDFIKRKITRFEENYGEFFTKEDIFELLDNNRGFSFLASRAIETPRDILRILNKTIFGQDKAILELSTFIFQWDSYFKAVGNNPRFSFLPPPSKARIVIGDTGVGKTFAIGEMANVLGYKLISVPGNRLTQEGFVGLQLSTEILSQMKKSGYGEEKNSKYIVLIDEADKILVNSSDIKFGVIHELLLMLEGNSIKGFDSYEKEKKELEISTDRVLFILSGCFDNIRQNYKSAIGFGRVQQDKTVSSDDLINFGALPREILGRVGGRPITFGNLDVDTLKSIILNSPKGLKYFLEFFKRHNLELSYSEIESQVLSIVEESVKNGLGARGCFSALDNYFLEKIANL